VTGGRAPVQPGVIKVLMSPGPDQLADNPSLSLLFRAAARQGAQISSFAGKASLLRRHDVIHIHFPEWLVRWRRGPVAAFDIAAIVVLVWLARRRGAVLVWTGHDLEPHELPRPWLWRVYSRLLLCQVDLLLSFGPGATALLVGRYPQLAHAATVVVPHGHYRGYYQAPPDAGAVRRQLRLDQRPVLLCFGLIRPYKNIPGLIRAWKQLPAPRPQLVIAGRAMDAQLAGDIEREASGEADLHLLLRFIAADEVPGLFAAADVVVLPYQARSALNSGVAHLALSLNRPAVLHDTPVGVDLRAQFGSDWVWLCGDTPQDAMRQALAATAVTRPPELDLRALDPGRLAAKTCHAYADAIAARRRR
jgi:beta-1,4-mannosyltransferase